MDNTYICKFCHKPCKNPNSLRNHERLCSLNPDFNIKIFDKLKRNISIHNARIKSGEITQWNKGKTKENNDSVKAAADKLKGRPSLMKGKHYSKKFDNSRGLSGGVRKGAGRGKRGSYKGFWCDSSWELAFLIYSLDHDIPITRNTESFTYTFEGKTHRYYPDFKINGKYIEIKGFDTDKTKAKIEQFPSDRELKVYHKSDLENVFEYVVSKYGENYIELYEDYIPKKKRKKESIYPKDKSGKGNASLLSEDIWLNRKLLILNSGVDFNSFGWKSNVRRITKLTRREIDRTIEHYKEDFSKFYIRK